MELAESLIVYAKILCINIKNNIELVKDYAQLLIQEFPEIALKSIVEQAAKCFDETILTIPENTREFLCRFEEIDKTFNQEITDYMANFPEENDILIEKILLSPIKPFHRESALLNYKNPDQTYHMDNKAAQKKLYLLYKKVKEKIESIAKYYAKEESSRNKTSQNIIRTFTFAERVMENLSKFNFSTEERKTIGKKFKLLLKGTNKIIKYHDRAEKVEEGRISEYDKIRDNVLKKYIEKAPKSRCKKDLNNESDENPYGKNPYEFELISESCEYIRMQMDHLHWMQFDINENRGNFCEKNRIFKRVEKRIPA